MSTAPETEILGRYLDRVVSGVMAAEELVVAKLQQGARTDALAVLALFCQQRDIAGPPTSASRVVSLVTTQPAAVDVVLRAGRPAVLELTGPADFRFERFVVRLTGRTLVRNLADAGWGTVSVDESPNLAQQVSTFHFTARARLTAIGAQTLQRLRCRIGLSYACYASSDFGPGASIAPQALDKVTVPDAESLLRWLHDRVIETEKVRFSTCRCDLLGNLVYLLLSPSNAVQMSLAIGPDTPLQVFQPVLAAGVEVRSRDLAGPLNQAWQQAAADKQPGDTVRVPLKLLAMTDGRVQVGLEGAWAHVAEGVRAAGTTAFAPQVEVRLDAWTPVVVEARTPTDQDVAPQAATVSLTVSGRLEDGLRAGLLDADLETDTVRERFGVRLDETFQVAQAFRLAPAATPPAVARTLTAVWLAVPRLPARPGRLTVALCAAAPDGQPDPAALATFEAELPLDTAAYVPGRLDALWFRAEAPHPIELDAVQAASPLFVVLSADAAGLDVVHRGQGPEAILPATRAMGRALFRHLAKGAGWTPRRFCGAPTQVLCDVEWLAQPAELANLLHINGAPGGLTTVRPADVAIACPAPTVRAATHSLRLTARARGDLRLSATTRLPAAG